jgi:hypothetical protein
MGRRIAHATRLAVVAVAAFDAVAHHGIAEHPSAILVTFTDRAATAFDDAVQACTTVVGVVAFVANSAGRVTIALFAGAVDVLGAALQAAAARRFAGLLGRAVEIEAALDATVDRAVAPSQPKDRAIAVDQAFDARSVRQVAVQRRESAVTISSAAGARARSATRGPAARRRGPASRRSAACHRSAGSSERACPSRICARGSAVLTAAVGNIEVEALIATTEEHAERGRSENEVAAKSSSSAKNHGEPAAIRSASARANPEG